MLLTTVLWWLFPWCINFYSERKRHVFNNFMQTGLIYVCYYIYICIIICNLSKKVFSFHGRLECRIGDSLPTPPKKSFLITDCWRSKNITQNITSLNIRLSFIFLWLVDFEVEFKASSISGINLKVNYIFLDQLV